MTQAPSTQMTPSPNARHSTNAVGATQCSSGLVSNDEDRKAWDRLIDRPLIEWGRNADVATDVGAEAPTGEIILLAIKVALALRDSGQPPPHRMVRDANGGIVFERQERGGPTKVIHIWDDATVEFQVFEGTQLRERISL